MRSLGLHKKDLPIFLIGIVFVVLNAIAIRMELMFVILIPLALLVLWAALFKLDTLLFFVVFCTPLSLSLEDLDLGGIGVYLPTEPILFGVLILFLFKIILGKGIDARIYKHPVSYAVYAYLAWMLITAVASTMPVVSFKFFLTRLWFIASFYFLAAHIFQNKANFKRYIWLYMIPLSGVIIYTIVRHAGFGFDKDSAHWVMSPFYKDHTSYGAVLAMYVPVAFGLVLLLKGKLALRVVAIGLFAILIVGFVLSYTRAAWVSVVVSVALLGFMYFRVRLNQLILLVAGIGTFIFLSFDAIITSLERNDSESSADFAEHVESISNVSSDASNLERLNRWDCAVQMFEEKPFFGWGPGTYQFQYAPFQRSENLTIISTNNADGGNAHSEYLGPLAESGVFGLITVVILFYLITSLGFRLYRNLPKGEIRTLALIFFLGWFTYIIHGVLNNYLDTDKASIPFWGFVAAMVAIDLFHSSDPASENSSIVNETISS